MYKKFSRIFLPIFHMHMRKKQETTREHISFIITMANRYISMTELQGVSLVEVLARAVYIVENVKTTARVKAAVVDVSLQMDRIRVENPTNSTDQMSYQ